MVGKLMCGHFDNEVLRFRNQGVNRTYCMMCVFDKLGVKSLEDQRTDVYKKTLEKKEQQKETEEDGSNAGRNKYGTPVEEAEPEETVEEVEKPVKQKRRKALRRTM